MNYFKTEKRTAFIAVLLIFVIFLPFSVHSAYADDAETVNSWPQAPSIYGASAILMDADSGAILYASNACVSLLRFLRHPMRWLCLPVSILSWIM